jgi:MFS family permease
MMKKKVSKTVKLLGSSSFFNDLGAEMVTPILPFFITSLGGTGAMVGTLSGLREGLPSLFKLLGGWLSDYVGKRRPFIFAGYIISILFRFLVGLSTSWQQLLTFVSFERLGKSRDAPRDAIIAHISKSKGINFGFHQTMDTLGALVGTLVVIFLFWYLKFDFKTIIFIASGVSILALIPLFFVKDHRARPIKKTLLEGIHLLDKKLKYFILVASIFALANFGLYLFLILRVQELTGSYIIPLAFYALFNLVYAIFLLPFGRLSDQIGRKKVLFLGYSLFFIVSFSFIFITNLVGIALLFAFYGLVYAITQSNQRAFVADMAGKMKGTALGFYYLIVGLVSILAGVVAGILWDINPAIMFSYLSVVSIVSIILLFFVKEKR